MKTRRVLATVGTAVAALSTASVVASAPASAAASDCPRGYVCIYPGASFSGKPIASLKFKTYGAHNLNNVTGQHRFYNNQTGGASAYACSGYNGTGRNLFGGSGGGSYSDQNFTPVNSVVLDRSGNQPTNC